MNTKELKFIEEYIKLCRKYELCLVSTDPFVGVEVSSDREEISNQEGYLKGDFGLYLIG